MTYPDTVAVGWHTIDTIRAFIPETYGLDEDVLWVYLDVAREQVEAYGHVIPEAETVPDSYLLAQGMQVRNLWNASTTRQGQSGDGTEYMPTVFPLDWVVKQIIRPQTAVPAWW